jgi:hypothetical protein
VFFANMLHFLPLREPSFSDLRRPKGLREPVPPFLCGVKLIHRRASGKHPLRLKKLKKQVRDVAALDARRSWRESALRQGNPTGKRSRRLSKRRGREPPGLRGRSALARGSATLRT